MNRDRLQFLFNKIFIVPDSADLEFIMGLLTISASAGALFVGVEHNTWLAWFLWASLPVCIVQVLSVYPFHNISVRHYSNYIMAFLAMFISLAIAQNGGDVTGIGGYAGIGCSCFYSAFKTRMKMTQ